MNTENEMCEKVQRNIELISILYKTKLDLNSTECVEPACRLGRCICMDREQAGLLLAAFSGKMTVSMEINEGIISYKNLQMPSEVKGACEVAGMFFSRISTDSERMAVNQMIREVVSSEGTAEIEKIVNSIPVIYMTNSTNNILERDSLTYLCVYDPNAQWYLDSLLQMAIRGAVDRGLNDTKENLEQYAQCMAEIFKRINDRAGQYEQKREGLIKVAKDYAESLSALANECKSKGKGYIYIRNAKNWLEAYCDNACINKCINAGYSACEAEKNRQWYRILKKIFEVMEIDTGIFPKLPFETSEPQKSDYDMVIQAIEELKGNEQKCQRVFEEIRKAFYCQEDIASGELLDKLLLAAGYTRYE